MSTKPITQQAPQEVSTHYLKKENLQDLLERLFPGQTEFHIRMKEDTWSFIAPSIVKTAELDTALDK